VRLAFIHHEHRFPKAIAADDEWTRFKRESFDRFVRQIKDIDAAASGLAERQRKLRALRREHHVLVVADRIRQRFETSSQTVSLDLKRAAEIVLDKAQLLGNPTGSRRRTSEEERYLTSARVSWHKLIKRAEVRPVERRGVAAMHKGPTTRKGSTKLSALRKAGIGPEEKAEILRRYVHEHLQQLVAVADGVTTPDEPPLPRATRLIIRELKTLCRRSRGDMSGQGKGAAR
jgi:hypothetical protein